MTITNISHIAIAVRDIDHSLPFWTDAVGMHVTLDSVEEVPGPGEPVRRRAVYLRDKEGANEPFIVLDQQLDGTAPGDPKAFFEIGVHHFGLWVDDVEPIAKRMDEAGHTILLGPVDCPTDRYGETLGALVRTLLVNDPEGNIIQFDQRVDGSAHERSDA